MKILYLFLLFLIPIISIGQANAVTITISGKVTGNLTKDKKYFYTFLKGDKIDSLKKVTIQKNGTYTLTLNNYESDYTADLYFITDSNTIKNNTFYAYPSKIIISQLKYSAINDLKIFNIKVTHDLFFNDYGYSEAKAPYIELPESYNSIAGSYHYFINGYDNYLINLKSDYSFNIQKAVMDSNCINGEEGFWSIKNNNLTLQTTTYTNRYIGLHYNGKKTYTFTKKTNGEEFTYIDNAKNIFERQYLLFEMRKDTSKIKTTIQKIYLERNQITISVSNQSDYPINRISFLVTLKNKKNNRIKTLKVNGNFINSTNDKNLDVALFPKLTCETLLRNIKIEKDEEEEEDNEGYMKTNDYEVSVKIIEYGVYK
jgi:hypothetical protein